MEEFSPQEFGKLILFVGLIITAVGGIMILLGHLGFFKLPGDLEFGGKNWKIYFPIASCLIISVILTLLFWLINFFRN